MPNLTRDNTIEEHQNAYREERRHRLSNQISMLAWELCRNLDEAEEFLRVFHDIVQSRKIDRGEIPLPAIKYFKNEK